MKSVSQKKSNTNIISIYILVCIAGLLLSIVVFNGMINKHDLEISNEICGLIAEKINSSITYITEAVGGRAEVLSNNKINDWDAMYHSLTDDTNVDGCVSIGLIDSNGKVYGKANEETELEKWGLKAQVNEEEGVFFSAPYRQEQTGQMVITIFAPIRQSGEKVGELFMTYELELFQKMANSDLLKDNLDIYLMNPFSNNYITCFCADSSLIGSWSNTRLLYDQIEAENKTYEQWEKQMQKGKNGDVITFKMHGVKYTQVFVNIDVMKDWSVVVRVPNDALSFNLRIFHMTVIGVIVILIILLFVLFIISAKKADSERKMLKHLSTYDTLTELANRRAFEIIYNDYINNHKEDKKDGALVFIDIDYFKQVNDGFGHAMGDRVLQEFAMIAKDIFAKNGVVSRFGGDEFIILIEHLESKELLENQLKEFSRRLKELDFLVDKDGTVFRIHFSAGIVEVSGGLESLEENEKCADKALYIVKQRGRDGFEWYNNQ